MARSRAGKKSEKTGTDTAIRGAVLEPVRMVRRELVSPNGEVVVVDVPVYPPFRLEGDERGRTSNEETPASS